ncbi:MAG: TlpA family protein disulfide reductase [Planctomycetes bacterium]|nr:TlpA family protein disulfide reductase [Planctomycetota bacterium]
MKSLIFPALLAMASVLPAQSATLKVGDPAPALDVEFWLKGDAVTAFQPGQCYVVEFWATWYPPCKDSMPHLSDLQDELGDKIVIIGLSDEEHDVAKKFLDDPIWAAQTRYTLGTDPDQSVLNAYMKAANQNGIPTSFLVNGEGKIAWIGHPAEMNRSLGKMLGVEIEEQDSEFQGREFQLPEERDWKSSAAAQAWMDKAVRALNKAGTKWDFKQTTSVMAGSMGGDMQKLPLTRTGTVERAGELGSRVDAQVIMDMPMMPEPMKSTSMVVLHQGVFYAKGENPMSMQAPQLRSITQADAEKLAKEFSDGPSQPTMAAFFDPNPIYADPTGSLQGIFKMCALELAEETDEHVVLRGPGSLMLSMMSGAGDGVPEEPQVELTIDKKNNRPLKLTVGDSNKPAYSMSFSNYTTVKEPDLERFVLNVEKRELPSLADMIREQMEMMHSMSSQGGGDVEFGDDEEF